MAKMTESAEKKKKKRWWIVLLSVFGVIAVLSLALFWIAMLLFGGEPQLPIEPLQAEDFQLIRKLTGLFSDEVLNGQQKEESELLFTPKEVSSLIRLSDNGGLLMTFGSGKTGNVETTKNYNVRFENGRFEIFAPLRTKLTWLRGGVIMLDMSVRPEKNGDELLLDISQIKAGSIALPGFLVDRIRRHLLEELQKQKEYQKFGRCVKRIRIDSENNLQIVYSPKELQKLILTQL